MRNDDEDAVADKDEAARTVMQNWSGGNGFSLALEKDKDDKSVVNQEKPLFRSANGQQEGEELVLGDRTIQRQEIELHSSSSFGEETGNSEWIFFCSYFQCCISQFYFLHIVLLLFVQN